jgi:hypothetical protein
MPAAYGTYLMHPLQRPAVGGLWSCILANTTSNGRCIFHLGTDDNRS